jgi:hypothetical protein
METERTRHVDVGVGEVDRGLPVFGVDDTVVDVEVAVDWDAHVAEIRVFASQTVEVSVCVEQDEAVAVSAYVVFGTVVVSAGVGPKVCVAELILEF